MRYFLSPSAEWKATRLTQLLEEAGQHEVYARRDGQVLMGNSGHLVLFDINELGQAYKVDTVDCVPFKPDNTVTLAE